MLTFLNTTDTSAITLDFGTIKTIGTINEENDIKISFNFNFEKVLDFSSVQESVTTESSNNRFNYRT